MYPTFYDKQNIFTFKINSIFTDCATDVGRVIIATDPEEPDGVIIKRIKYVEGNERFKKAAIYRNCHTLYLYILNKRFILPVPN